MHAPVWFWHTIYKANNDGKRYDRRSTMYLKNSFSIPKDTTGSIFRVSLNRLSAVLMLMSCDMSHDFLLHGIFPISPISEIRLRMEGSEKL